jgi:hypothetical protein
MNECKVNCEKFSKLHILSSAILGTPGLKLESKLSKIRDAPEAADRLMVFHFQRQSPLQTLGT